MSKYRITLSADGWYETEVEAETIEEAEELALDEAVKYGNYGWEVDVVSYNDEKEDEQ